MQKCERKHSRCSISNEYLPTRVIDVTSLTLRLVESKPTSTGTYAALSHCWGMCRSFLTTRSNLADRKSGFNIDDLPATFRNAVSVTRSLGIPYLWIDSICILQGDKEDWEIEGSKMADVYSNAYLTIAAANAAGDAEGFLKARKPEKILPIDIRFASSENNIDEREIGIYVQPRCQPTTVYEPLDGRAWCLQERCLSPRILFFDTNALRWECIEKGWFEAGRGFKRQRLIVQEVIPRLLHNGTISYIGWYNMVENYTTRAISYPSDKLPALSALTAYAARESNDKYFAGLWKGDLRRGLLWCRQVRRNFRAHEPSEPFEDVRKSLDAAIAPSWSWASFQSAIHFTVMDPSSTYLEVLSCTNVIDVSIIVPGKNPYGEVASGYLIISAPLISFATDIGWDTTDVSEIAVNRAWEHNVLLCPELEEIDISVESSFDYPAEIRCEVFGLPLTFSVDTAGNFYEEGDHIGRIKGDGEEWKIVQGIILCKKDDGGDGDYYVRVGCFRIHPIRLSDFMARVTGMPRRMVKIV